MQGQTDEEMHGEVRIEVFWFSKLISLEKDCSFSCKTTHLINECDQPCNHTLISQFLPLHVSCQLFS